ncbi:cleavage stimulation factor subunit 3-like [Zophobas morio]|uniref:cleavage stimulation factor subunit 3-like n=1 Tax=Zophobas morio TaxID=2755281 RepID=UPI00308356B3
MAVTIERYRYLDLLPCSGLECKFFGVSPAMEATTARDGSQKADAAVHDVSMPDTQQMIKFNPEAECTTPEYLAPLSVLQLMKFTSPRGPTRDPLVDVDELLAVLRRIELPSMSDNKKRGQDQLGLDTSSASNLFMSRRRKVANL